MTRGLSCAYQHSHTEAQQSTLPSYFVRWACGWGTDVMASFALWLIACLTPAMFCRYLWASSSDYLELLTHSATKACSRRARVVRVRENISCWSVCHFSVPESNRHDLKICSSAPQCCHEPLQFYEIFCLCLSDPVSNSILHWQDRHSSQPYLDYFCQVLLQSRAHWSRQPSTSG